MRIIDARVRLPFEFRPKDNSTNANEFYSQYDAVLGLLDTQEKSLQDLKEEMKAANVSHSIIHAEYEYGDSADALNEAVAELVSKEPTLFSWFGTISMENLDPVRAVKQLNRVKELGLIGINIQPGFFNMAIDDKKLYPVYSKANELGLAVAIHTGINYSTRHPIRNEHPLLLDEVACDFRDLKLIACHASWPWIPEIIAVARKHPNIYMDFGGLSPKYISKEGSGWEVMYRFMNNLVSDRVLFATDWPVFPMERAVQEWKSMDLKEDVKEKVLGGNAEQLFFSNVKESVLNE